MKKEVHKDFQDIARIAAQVSNTPIALVSFFESGNAWVKAGYGFGENEYSKAAGLCSRMMHSQESLIVVPDVQADAALKNYPLTLAGSPIRFYACAFLLNSDGQKVGTLAVMSHQTAYMNSEQLESLAFLACTIVQKMEIREALSAIRQMGNQYGEPVSRPDSFATSITHDLKTPLSTIVSFHDLLRRLEPVGALGEHGGEALDIVKESAQRLVGMAAKVPAVLQQALPFREEKEWVDIRELVTETLSLLLKPAGASVELDLQVYKIYSVRNALQQILLNLCSNAFRYIAKPGGTLRIATSENASVYLLYVSDNGPGIPQPRLRRIFDLLYGNNLPDDDDTHQTGRGFGLSMVKRLATSLGGAVLVDTEEGVGTTFCVSLPKAG